MRVRQHICTNRVGTKRSERKRNRLHIPDNRKIRLSLCDLPPTNGIRTCRIQFRHGNRNAVQVGIRAQNAVALIVVVGFANAHPKGRRHPNGNQNLIILPHRANRRGILHNRRQHLFTSIFFFCVVFSIPQSVAEIKRGRILFLTEPFFESTTPENRLYKGCDIVSPTVCLPVGTSPSLLTVNRGGGQRGGRVPSWQENCFLQLPPRFSPARFQRFSRYRLLLLAPFLRRRGSFCSGTLLFRPSFSNFPLLFLF